jgi:hypothetical protein
MRQVGEERASTLGIGELSWDEEHLTESLQEVFRHAVAEAESSIQWYLTRIRTKRFWARAIRLAAIGCGAAAGILPMVAQLPGNENAIPPVWASIFLALAAALVVLDRFFGFSKGWMRFIATEMKLREILEEFRLDWESARAAWKGHAPGEGDVQEMLARAKRFVGQVHRMLRQETGAWIEEFQTALSEIDQAAKKEKREAEAQAAGDVRSRRDD